MKTFFTTLIVLSGVFHWGDAFGQAPSWVWTNGGGFYGNDGGTNISVDVNGNMYVAGYFEDSSITFGGFTLMNKGGYDLFVVKYDSSGNVLWAYNDDESGLAAFDKNGNLYLAGSFFTDSLYFGNILLTNPDFSPEIFIAKYDTLGNILWAKSSNGTDSGICNSIELDSAGNVYISGYFESQVLTFGTVTINNASGNGDPDPFIAKYDAFGNVVWAKPGNGILIDVGLNMTVDKIGNSYITGHYISSTIHFGNNSLINNSNHYYTDIFIVKYDPNGNVSWAKSFGGDSIDSVDEIVFDKTGNIYITGYFRSPSISFGNYTLLTSGTSTFIVKMDSSGNVIRAKIDSTGIEKELEVDLNGNLFMTGVFYTPTVTFGNITLTNNNNSGDIFIVKYDSAGNVVWAKSAGGNKKDVAIDIAVDLNGNTYITGYYQSASIAFGNTTLFNDSVGINDFYIAKLDSTVVIGLNETNKNSVSLTISPNPTTTTVTITSPLQNANTLTLYDITGRTLLQQFFNGTTQIDVSNLARGMYIAEVRDKNGNSVNGKLLKE